MGKMHTTRVAHGPRLQKIVAELQEAEQPLTSEEITARCFEKAVMLLGNKARIPLNVSSYMGDIRADEEGGYGCSYSTRWVVAAPGQEPGKRVNKDNSVTFFIDKATQPWHDARPRYYLLAAPDWAPRWGVNDAGALVPYTTIQQCGIRNAECGINTEIEDAWMRESGDTVTLHLTSAVGKTENMVITETSNQDPVPRTSAPDFKTTGPGAPCKLQRCGRPIPEGKPENSEFCCLSHKDEYWKNIRDIGKSMAMGGQEKLGF